MCYQVIDHLFFQFYFFLSFSSTEMEEYKSLADSGNKDIDQEDDGVNLSSAVLLEETPLPRMFIPGKIVHIYTHRGGKSFVLV